MGIASRSDTPLPVPFAASRTRGDENFDNKQTYAMLKMHEENPHTVCKQEKNINDTLKWSTFEDILSRGLQLSEMLLLYGQTFSDPNNDEGQVFKKHESRDLPLFPRVTLSWS